MTRDRSDGPDVLAFFTGLAWDELRILASPFLGAPSFSGSVLGEMQLGETAPPPPFGGEGPARRLAPQPCRWRGRTGDGASGVEVLTGVVSVLRGLDGER